MWLVGGLLLAGLVILAWVTVPTFRRRYAFNVPRYSRTTSAAPALFKPKHPYAAKENFAGQRLCRRDPVRFRCN